MPTLFGIASEVIVTGMQYSVPQFVEVEDKIIGPLTLKQFLILLAGGLLALAFWRIFDFGLFFFVFILPVVFLALILAFARFNGRPIMASAVSLLQFYVTPRYRVFKRIGDDMPMITKGKHEDISEKNKKQNDAGTEKSRLRKLAYLLDQKTAEEERLIHSGEAKKQWLNQI